MTESLALKFNKFVIEAGQMGLRMKNLSEAVVKHPDVELPDYWDEKELTELSEKCYAISEVLLIIRDTPNAYLNAEAMEALREEVEAAVRVERQDWAQELLRTINPDWMPWRA
jgi:hypothetical protein